MADNGSRENNRRYPTTKLGDLGRRYRKLGDVIKSHSLTGQEHRMMTAGRRSILTHAQQRNSLALPEHNDGIVAAVERADVAWFVDRLKTMLQWERLSPHLPPWPDPHQSTPTADHVVGLVLHCAILSAVVLGAAIYQGLTGLVRFVCYVTLHWYVHRRRILPISESTPGPITLRCIENATLMETNEFRVILISTRPQSPNTPLADRSPAYNLSLSHYTSPSNSASDVTHSSALGHRDVIKEQFTCDLRHDSGDDVSSGYSLYSSAGHSLASLSSHNSSRSRDSKVIGQLDSCLSLSPHKSQGSCDSEVIGQIGSCPSHSATPSLPSLADLSGLSGLQLQSD